MTPCFKVPARLEKQLEQETTPRGKEGVDEDPDVKVIVLGNSHRGGAANSFCFEVLRWRTVSLRRLSWRSSVTAAKARPPLSN